MAEAVNFVPAMALIMLLCMALPAEQFKVPKIRQNLRIRNVIGIDIGLMVHYLARYEQPLLQAAFTQTATHLLVCNTACLPLW